MIYIYNVILLIFSIPAAIFFLLKSINDPSKGIFFKWKERFGLWNLPENLLTKDIIWFHGASVGEVKALEPLIKQFKGYTALMTVITPAGRILAEKNKLSELLFLAPLDFEPVVKNVLNKVKPKAIILFETEVWPGLINEAKKQGVKVILINGRLSSSSYPFYKVFRAFWKNIINKIDVLCVRSKEDAERFKGIGFTNPIEVTGNIKYDKDIAMPDFSRESAKLSGSDIVFVAGSTREEEERILTDVFIELKKKFTALKIVIAPRRIEKTNNLVNILKEKKINFARYSEGIKQPYDCLIIDTFGDLVKFYAISDITFVGKSLINKGGQNPIEPASYSKAVLFGPYMQNFQTEAESLVAAGGGFSVKNKEELEKKLEALLSNKELLKEAGRKAYETVLKQRGALNKTREIILNFIK